jgi:hypothetical protein
MRKFGLITAGAALALAIGLAAPARAVDGVSGTRGKSEIFLCKIS